MGACAVYRLDTRDYLYLSEQDEGGGGYNQPAAGAVVDGRSKSHFHPLPTCGCLTRDGADVQACTLCDQLDGAVIQCTDCVVSFHASCAWLLGYKFGFEFTLVCLHHITACAIL